MAMEEEDAQAAEKELGALLERAQTKLENRRNDGNKWQSCHIALGVGCILLAATTSIAVWAGPDDTGVKILLTALGALGSACGAIGTFLNAQLRSVQNKAEEGDWRAIHSKAKVQLLKGVTDWEDLERLQSEEAEQIRADADARLKSQGPSVRALLKDFDLVPKKPGQGSNAASTPPQL